MSHYWVRRCCATYTDDVGRAVTSAVVIELVKVAKVFGGGVSALRDVSFSVPTGSVCALLGHNGAGKTTTVNILSTLVRPTSGQAIVAGYDVAREPGRVRENIGVTGQDAALDLRLTGRENLVFFGRLRGLRHQQARSRADELIHQFDMDHAADRQVGQYSGGMRRRIDIAVSLVVPPQVLFLDEPTTGLDPRSRREVWQLVSALSAQNITVLLTTQYLEEADVLSDLIVILNAGQIVASGTSNELKSQTGMGYCQMTALNPADTAPRCLSSYRLRRSRDRYRCDDRGRACCARIHHPCGSIPTRRSSRH